MIDIDEYFVRDDKVNACYAKLDELENVDKDIWTEQDYRLAYECWDYICSHEKLRGRSIHITVMPEINEHVHNACESRDIAKQELEDYLKLK